MTSLIEEYIKCRKGNISEKEYIFRLTESKIQINNDYVELFDWQNEMLLRLINIAYHNQSKAIYNNTSLMNCISINGYIYNIMILMNGQIYIYNIHTGKFREIKYKFEEI